MSPVKLSKEGDMYTTVIDDIKREIEYSTGRQIGDIVSIVNRSDATTLIKFTEGEAEVLTSELLNYRDFDPITVKEDV